MEKYSKPQKQLFAFLFFTLFSLNSYSTCIVFIRTNDAIYIAADSKRTFPDGKPPQSIYKVHNVGKVFFAVSGHNDYRLYHIADSTLRLKKNVNVALDYFSRYMVKYYNKRMFLEKKAIASPSSTYRYYLTNDLAGVTFVTYNSDGSLFFKEVRFYMTESNGIPKIHSQIFALDNLCVLGYSDHILKLNNDDLRKIANPDKPELLAEGLVKIEMNQHPEHIGEPIILLKINKDNSVYWFRKNPSAVKFTE